jgi:hypothetical protein
VEEQEEEDEMGEEQMEGGDSSRSRVSRRSGRRSRSARAARVKIEGPPTPGTKPPARARSESPKGGQSKNNSKQGGKQFYWEEKGLRTPNEYCASGIEDAWEALKVAGYKVASDKGKIWPNMGCSWCGRVFESEGAVFNHMYMT